MSNNSYLKSLCHGIPDILPTFRSRDESIPHAPYRNNKLNQEEKQVIFIGIIFEIENIYVIIFFSVIHYF